MKKGKSSLTAIIGFVAALTVNIATPANAACTMNSVWQKVSGTSPSHTIKGRHCGANKSVRLIGAVDTGWIIMHDTGPGSLSATFVDNHITTAIQMQVTGTSMSVFMTHTANNGTVGNTQAQYTLLSLQ